MHDASRVGGGDGAADLVEDVDGLLERKGAVGVEATSKVLSFEQLHDDVSNPVCRLIEIEGLYDVLVADGAGDFGLALKSLENFELRGEVSMNELDGEAPRQPEVRRLVDRAHPAFADEAFDPVCPSKNETRSRLKFHDPLE